MLLARSEKSLIMDPYPFHEGIVSLCGILGGIGKTSLAKEIMKHRSIN